MTIVYHSNSNTNTSTNTLDRGGFVDQWEVKEVKDVDFNSDYDPYLKVKCDRGCAHKLKACIWCGRQCLYSHSDTFDVTTYRLIVLDIRNNSIHRCSNRMYVDLDDKGLLR